MIIKVPSLVLEDDRPPDLNQCQGGPGGEALNALRQDGNQEQGLAALEPALPPAFHDATRTRGSIRVPGALISSVITAGEVQLYQRMVARSIHRPSSLLGRLDWSSRRSIVIIDDFDCAY